MKLYRLNYIDGLVGPSLLTRIGPEELEHCRHSAGLPPCWYISRDGASTKGKAGETWLMSRVVAAAVEVEHETPAP